MGICAIIAWTGTLTALMFGILKAAGVFRVSEEMERKGTKFNISFLFTKRVTLAS